MIRVLIVDDQPLVRAGLAAVLEPEQDISVVGQAANGREALERARVLHPDVVLLDIRMPVVDGLTAAREFAAQAIGGRILMLTTFDLDAYVYEALKAGASGFLLKDADASDLVHAVRTVARGDQLLAPQLTRRLIERFTDQQPVIPPAENPSVGELTPRELEVLLSLAAGKSNAEIAAELFLGEATVKTHLTRILDKLGLRDRVQAVVFAYETGLVRPGTQPEPSG